MISAPVFPGGPPPAPPPLPGVGAAPPPPPLLAPKAPSQGRDVSPGKSLLHSYSLICDHFSQHYLSSSSVWDVGYEHFDCSSNIIARRNGSQYENERNANTVIILLICKSSWLFSCQYCIGSFFVVLHWFVVIHFMLTSF